MKIMFLTLRGTNNTTILSSNSQFFENAVITNRATDPLKLLNALQKSKNTNYKEQNYENDSEDIRAFSPDSDHDTLSFPSLVSGHTTTPPTSPKDNNDNEIYVSTSKLRRRINLTTEFSRELFTKMVLEESTQETTFSIYCVALPDIIYKRFKNEIYSNTSELISNPQKFIEENASQHKSKNEVLKDYLAFAQTPFLIPADEVQVLGMINCTVDFSRENLPMHFQLIKNNFDNCILPDLEKNFSLDELINVKKAIDSAYTQFNRTLYRDNKELHSALFRYGLYARQANKQEISWEQRVNSSQNTIQDYFTIEKDYRDKLAKKDKEEFADITIQCGL